MTRAFAALLLALAALLAGCGDDGPPDSTGDSNTENQQTESPSSSY
jgi:predicted small lipoprotein YifL